MLNDWPPPEAIARLVENGLRVAREHPPGAAARVEWAARLTRAERSYLRHFLNSERRGGITGKAAPLVELLTETESIWTDRS